MIIYQKKPMLASENLAINNICLEKIKNNEHEFLARIYYHKKAAILARNESKNDLQITNCERLGYEIAKRPTGGSAIIVNSKNAICYSLFFKKNYFKKAFNISFVYKKITFLLAKKLGNNFSVKGTYYLRHNNIPLAGHAMRTLNNAIQFDGVLHLTNLDSIINDELIKTRKLYDSELGKIVFFDNNYYSLKNQKKLNQNPSNMILLSDENEEIKKIKGLNSTDLTLENFLNCFYETINELFQNQEIFDSIQPLNINEEEILKHQSKILNEDYLLKGKTRRGHCFVDFLEPENQF